MDIKTKIQLADFLRQHCHRNGDGCAVYDDTWSDRRVMEEFNKNAPEYLATMHHVSTLREDCVGLLTDNGGPGRGYGVFASRLTTLEARVAALEEMIK
jgi:hypothetical protein